MLLLAVQNELRLSELTGLRNKMCSATVHYSAVKAMDE